RSATVQGTSFRVAPYPLTAVLEPDLSTMAPQPVAAASERRARVAARPMQMSALPGVEESGDAVYSASLEILILARISLPDIFKRLEQGVVDHLPLGMPGTLGINELIMIALV